MTDDATPPTREVLQAFATEHPGQKYPVSLDQLGQLVAAHDDACARALKAERERDEAREMAKAAAAASAEAQALCCFAREHATALEQQVAELNRELAAREAERDEAIRLSEENASGAVALLDDLNAARAKLAEAEALAVAGARGVVALREAFLRVSDALINDENLHETNDDGDVCEGGDGCKCELVVLINTTAADTEPLAREHDEKLLAKAHEIWRAGIAADVAKERADERANVDEEWRHALRGEVPVGRNDRALISDFKSLVTRAALERAADCAEDWTCPECDADTARSLATEILALASEVKP